MNALVCGSGASSSSRRLRIAERLRDEGMTVVECDSADVPAALEGFGGRVDVLVTVSDQPADASLESTSDEEFLELLDANLSAAFRASRACFGAMRAHGGGSMIHVSSEAGIRAAHETAAYSIASAGVIALSELFAAEGADHGIRANAVCPRAGVDVGPVVAWLASDASAHVNGATIRVDDGTGAAMVLDTRA